MSCVCAHHDPRNDRVPGGAVQIGTCIRIRLYAAACDGAVLRVWNGREYRLRMDRTSEGYEATLSAPNHPCLLWYRFELMRDGALAAQYGAAERYGDGVLTQSEPASFQITVYDACCETPQWLRRGVMLQVFPDRFCRSDAYRPPDNPDRTLHARWNEAPLLDPDPRSQDNRAFDFFGGNLRGICDKLPFLHEMGFTVLYLNPIFQARSNHRYDTGDYTRIDPQLGTEEDFVELCAQADKLGIRIMLDGVFSHTGEDSVYFNRYGRYPCTGAYQSPASPYASWYSFEHFPDKYRCWWGVPTLPEVNEEDPGYLDFIVRGKDAVIAKWLRAGASGWRLDVADELPDVFLDALYKRVKQEKPDAAVLGEVWEDASRKVAYGRMRRYLLGGQMDSVMNYPLRDAMTAFLLGACTADATRRQIEQLRDHYPAPVFHALMNLMGSHDRVRAVCLLSGAAEPPRHEQAAHRLNPEQRSLGLSRMRLFFLALCALPGVPCVYYGDDAGIEGWSDPYNRRTYPWGGEDRAHQTFFRAAIALRKGVPALAEGSLSFLPQSEDVLAFARELGGETLVCAVNRSEEPRQALLPLQAGRPLLTEGTLLTSQALGSGTLITLGPRSGLIAAASPYESSIT